ncbi:MAG: DNA primase [Parachlamydia sp.]|nr:DNA primase [Parachlamydia sp.]
MPIFSKESLETLRQRIDLVDVLSAHIDLKRAGASYKAPCPFHDEKTPSFMVQKGDQHYHCFGCGAHGDAITFLMTHLKLSFNQAVESLAQQFHVHLEVVEGETKGPNKGLLKEALDQACRFFHFYLLHTEEGHEALQYLHGRGIDEEFIRHFQIGLAPKAPGVLRKVMHQKFIKDETMAEAGLIAAGKEGGWRDFFHDRITFPICDAAGAVIGFSARKYREKTFGGKYVNTPETPLFKKSRVLFGLHHSRRRIAKERKAIVVEGQIDALKLIQAGFNITVAGQGTAFGEGHVKELVNLGLREIFLALDSDEAGQEAARKIGDLFQREGIEVRVVRLPSGLDPDAYLRKESPEAFVKLLQEAMDYLTFLVKHESRKVDLNSPAGKNELVQHLTRQIRDWNQPLMVHESLRKLSHLLQVPESMVTEANQHTPNVYIKKSGSVGMLEIDPDRILEADLLRWLLLLGETRPDLLQIAECNMPPDQLLHPLCRKFYEVYLSRAKAGEPRDLLGLMAKLESEESGALVAELLQKKINKERAETSFMECLQKILDRNWMQRREAIKTRLHSGQCSDEEANELAKQFDEIRKNPPKVQV